MYTPGSGSSNKRPAEANTRDGTVASASKKAKVSVIPNMFSKAPLAASTSNFQWLKSLGPARTCMHGINLTPPSRAKVAAFDLDGTVIKNSIGTVGGRNKTNWEWWRPVVPERLKELHDSGFAIVLISNQTQCAPTHKGACQSKCLSRAPAYAPGPKTQVDQVKIFRDKVTAIAETIPDVPFRVFAATAKDGYRKPLPGMWTELESILKQDDIIIDKASSFFVGDAAGRPFDFKTRQPKDHSASDRKLALNVGVDFHTPEEYFLTQTKRPFVLNGLNTSTIPINPAILPSNTPLIPTTPSPEIILFVGLPCIGKTTFFHKHLEPVGYVHVNYELLKTRLGCLKAAEAALAEGKSCVIDHTNENESTRKLYIDLAKRLGCSIRCFHFTGSEELAKHNNLYRAFVANMSTSKAVSDDTFKEHASAYQKVTLDEGFNEIKTIGEFFDGDDRENWEKWLQVDNS